MVNKNRKNLSTNTKKKSVDAETVWKDFSATLVKWKLAYELWQKAGKEAMSKYLHVMQSLGPKVELPKQMSKNWEKIMEWVKNSEKYTYGYPENYDHPNMPSLDLEHHIEPLRGTYLIDYYFPIKEK